MVGGFSIYNIVSKVHGSVVSWFHRFHGVSALNSCFHRFRGVNGFIVSHVSWSQWRLVSII